HRARWIRGGAIQQGVGATRHTKIRAARLDAIALAGNAQLVERVTQGGGVEPACALNVGIFFAHVSFSAYVRKHRPSPRLWRLRSARPWPWRPRAQQWLRPLPAPARHP